MRIVGFGNLSELAISRTERPSARYENREIAREKRGKEEDWEGKKERGREAGRERSRVEVREGRREGGRKGGR